MLEIKLPSIQRYTRVDLSSTGTNNTYLIFAYDFKTLTKEEKESSAIDKLMNRLTYQLRKTVLDIGPHIKKLYLEEIIATVKENVKNGILSSLKEFQSSCNNFRAVFEYESEINRELALLERFDMMNSIFVTFWTKIMRLLSFTIHFKTVNKCWNSHKQHTVSYIRSTLNVLVSRTKENYYSLLSIKRRTK